MLVVIGMVGSILGNAVVRVEDPELLFGRGRYVGDLPFEALVCADAWLMAPPSSEGFAVGSAAAAYMLQE